jgi:hypothetical protein
VRGFNWAFVSPVLHLPSVTWGLTVGGPMDNGHPDAAGGGGPEGHRPRARPRRCDNRKTVFRNTGRSSATSTLAPVLRAALEASAEPVSASLPRGLCPHTPRRAMWFAALTTLCAPGAWA